MTTTQVRYICAKALRLRLGMAEQTLTLTPVKQVSCWVLQVKPYQKQQENSVAVSSMVPTALRVLFPEHSCMPAQVLGRAAATGVQSLEEQLH